MRTWTARKVICKRTFATHDKRSKTPANATSRKTKQSTRACSHKRSYRLMWRQQQRRRQRTNRQTNRLKSPFSVSARPCGRRTRDDGGMDAGTSHRRKTPAPAPAPAQAAHRERTTRLDAHQQFKKKKPSQMIKRSTLQQGEEASTDEESKGREDSHVKKEPSNACNQQRNRPAT